MALKFLKQRWHKIIASISVVFILLLLIFSFFVNKYWSPVLASKIKDVVLKTSDSLYSVDFSSAELHIIRGSIVFNNVTLKPDTAVYNRKKLLHLAPNNLVQLKIQKLTLSHIHPFSLYFHNRLNIGEIILNRPELNVSYQLNHTRDTVLKDNRTAWQKISKNLRSIRIGSIILGDVNFRYEDYSGNKVAISELKELNLSASDMLIDSATQTDKSRLLYCRDIVAELSNYTAKTPSGLYSYKIDHLELSTQKSQLNIEGFALHPVTAGVFFDKTHNDRYNCHLDSLQLNNFNFLSYHKYRSLSATSLALNNGAIQIFGNPRPSDDKSDRARTFPSIGLRKIYADMKIDTINLHHINVYYTEFNTKSKQTGSVSFNNTSGRFLNVTSNDAALQKNNNCNVQLTSYFMNRGKLNVSFNFNLTDKNSVFSYKGSLGPMELKSVNSATMPLTMIKITSGTIKQLSFDIHADKSRANGKILVLYNNLKVTLLKADTTNDKLKKKTLESMYANLFILKHDNPDVAGGVPRSYLVDYTRPKETAFFASLWKTLLSGIKPAVGLDKKTQEKVKALATDISINKQNRKIKKKARKQKRAERKKKRDEKMK